MLHSVSSNASHLYQELEYNKIFKKLIIYSLISTALNFIHFDFLSFQICCFIFCFKKENTLNLVWQDTKIRIISGNTDYWMALIKEAMCCGVFKGQEADEDIFMICLFIRPTLQPTFYPSHFLCLSNGQNHSYHFYIHCFLSNIFFLPSVSLLVMFSSPRMFGLLNSKIWLIITIRQWQEVLSWSSISSSVHFYYIYW